MIRPGAELAPLWVWQLLQSPVDTAVPIARVLPLKVTFAVMGKVSRVEPWKFPETELAVNVAVTPFRSVTVTTAPPAPLPLQSSGSCPLGKTVPATLKVGPFCCVWQVMQARPGSMSELPCVPEVQYELLVQVGAAPSGSGGGGGPASGAGGGTPPSTTQLPAAIPAVTQAWKPLTSAAGTDAFGAGGMGEVVDWIRATGPRPVALRGVPG